MKTWMKLLAAAGLVLLVLSVDGFAQGERRNCVRSINARQQRQQQRVLNGIRSDDLTNREIARLETQQARISGAEARARTSGGEFTVRERARIQERLNRSSWNIYRQRHDPQDRTQ